MSVSPVGRVIATALVLISGAALAASWAADQGYEAPSVQTPTIQAVEILGADNASEVAIRHLANLREGDSLLVDLDAVVERVNQHPWIDSVAVSRDLTGTVRIRVTEHRPVMLLSHDGLYRVSSSGEVFIRARSSALDLPILTGLDSQLIDAHGEVAREVVAHAVGLLAAVGDSSQALDPAAISEVHFDRDLGFTLILRSGSRVRLGFSPPTAQLARLDAVVRGGLDLSVPHEVDLDMADMAVVTPLTS